MWAHLLTPKLQNDKTFSTLGRFIYLSIYFQFIRSYNIWFINCKVWKNLTTKVNNTQYLYNHFGYGHNSFEGCDSHTEASGWCSGMVIAPTGLKTCNILFLFHLYLKKYKLIFFDFKGNHRDYPKVKIAQHFTKI